MVQVSVACIALATSFAMHPTSPWNSDLPSPAGGEHSLREAAARCGRSMTTLRRHIRSGRVRARLHPGRFGPEYVVSDAELRRAFPDIANREREAAAQTIGSENDAPAGFPERWLRESIPLSLFQELQMKHEQLLVQYGMVRAAGLRGADMENEIDRSRREAETLRSQISEMRDRRAADLEELRRELRQAELELEGRALTIAALGEKVKALELLLQRNPEPGPIEESLREIRAQTRWIDEYTAGSGRAPAPNRGSFDTNAEAER